ncbi:MAG TPA: hypothetical protein VIX91_18020 [Candidatus Acidoferrum sp.]
MFRPAFRWSVMAIAAAASVSLTLPYPSLSAKQSSSEQAPTTPFSQPAQQTPDPPPRAISRQYAPLCHGANISALRAPES